MTISEIHEGFKEIDFTNGTSIIRNDWQASLEARKPLEGHRHWIIAFGDGSGRQVVDSLAEAIQIALDDGAEEISRAY